MTENTNHHQLTRSLSRNDAIAILISCIIGSGLFATPGIALNELKGATGTFFICYSVGAFVGMCSGFVWAELACLLPSAGGDYGKQDSKYMENLNRTNKFEQV